MTRQEAMITPRKPDNNPMTTEECLQILDQLDCGVSEGKIEECKDMLRAALLYMTGSENVQRQFSVNTTIGQIQARENMDSEDPGIFLIYIDKEGKEHSSCSMLYFSEEGELSTSVWGPKHPDDDPVFTMKMD